jgi:hypothetical protein
MSLARKLFHLQGAMALEWAPRAMINALQLRRLKSILRFAEASQSSLPTVSQA